MPEVMSVADRVAARHARRPVQGRRHQTRGPRRRDDRRPGATPARSCNAGKVVQVDLVGVDASPNDVEGLKKGEYQAWSPRTPPPSASKAFGRPSPHSKASR
jgi:hypothetical protein